MDKVRLSFDVPGDMTINALAQALADLGATNVNVGGLESESEPQDDPRKGKTYQEVLINAGVPREDLLLARNSVEHKLDRRHESLPAGEVLGGAFIWSETPQGHFYWADIQRALYAKGFVTAGDIFAARKEVK